MESTLIALLATAVAGFLVTSLLPSFTHLISKQLAFSITSSYVGPLFLVGLGLMVGILAGIYPAFVLSSFNPVRALKGDKSMTGKSGWLKKSLVVMQFTASIVIIIGTLVIYNQINYMLNKNLGFDKDKVFVIERPGVLGNDLEVFKNDLLLKPAISQVVNSYTLPGKNYEIRSYRPTDEKGTFLFKGIQVDFGYEKMMGLQLVSGRFFSREFGADSNAIVINETAAKNFGFEDPLGEKLTSPWHMNEFLTIIGVVKDYNIASLHTKIEPVALRDHARQRRGIPQCQINQRAKYPRNHRIY